MLESSESELKAILQGIQMIFNNYVCDKAPILDLVCKY